RLLPDDHRGPRSAARRLTHRPRSGDTLMAATAGTLEPRTGVALRILAPVAVGLAVLGLWQFLVTVVGVSDYLLPSPAAIADQFTAFLPTIVSATGITGLNALLGLVAGTVIAVLLAALAAASKPV